MSDDSTTDFGYEAAPSDAHETALACLDAGVRAALPETVVRSSCTLEGDTLHIRSETGSHAYDLAAYDRLVVLGGGKASTGVATALADLLGDHLTGGVVVSTTTNDASRTDVDGRLSVLEGDHPTPSARNVAGTRDLLETADAADAETLVLAVITGGASALLAAPAGDLSLADLQATTDALLESGATIDEVNAVRKHCSAIKGGQLARRCAPATVCTLTISDVVGDDPSVIGSGPTVPDDSTFADALAAVDRYDLRERLPATVLSHLEAGLAGEHPETPATLEGGASAEYHLLATGRTAIEAARTVADERGYNVLVLSGRLRGEASEVGRVHAAIAEEIHHDGDPIEGPAVVLSGGEVTVTVRGEGTGGPNQELALATAIELAEGGTDAVLASADTDGIDGPTDAAGAIVDRETVRDLDVATRALANNDVYELLDDWDALLTPGYTGTNVNDLRALVVPAGGPIGADGNDDTPA